MLSFKSGFKKQLILKKYRISCSVSVKTNNEKYFKLDIIAIEHEVFKYFLSKI